LKDFPVPPRRAGHIKLPTPFDPTAARFLRAAGELVRSAEVVEPDEVKTYTPKWQGGRARARGRTPAERLATLHPVAACPDAPQHLRALARAERLERNLAAERRQKRNDEASLSRQLDRVLTVLGELGFVDGWALTEAGDRLARLYHECDLLIADCIGAGLLDGLDPAELAGLVSVITFEARGVDVATLPVPAGLHARVTEIESHLARLAGLEKRAHLPLTRDIDEGFVGAAYAWAKGEALHDVLADGITGGDFVRNIKQLVDLLRQIAIVAPVPATAKAASQAADALFRGVVIASSVVGAG
jgi:ATP-dependent RNA helicase HelY